jgi:hypothetical protein
LDAIANAYESTLHVSVCAMACLLSGRLVPLVLIPHKELSSAGIFASISSKRSKISAGRTVLRILSNKQQSVVSGTSGEPQSGRAGAYSHGPNMLAARRWHMHGVPVCLSAPLCFLEFAAS